MSLAKISSDAPPLLWALALTVLTVFLTAMGASLAPNAARAQIEEECGAAIMARTPVAPARADRQIICAQEVPQGIQTSENNLAIIYGLTASPYISHAGRNAEVYILPTARLRVAQRMGAGNNPIYLFQRQGGDYGLVDIAEGAMLINSRLQDDIGSFLTQAVYVLVFGGTGERHIRSAGTISTRGADGDGLSILIYSDRNGANLDVGEARITLNGGSVSTLGADAYGLYAIINYAFNADPRDGTEMGDAIIDITDGAISTSGDYAHAVLATSDLIGRARIAMSGGSAMTSGGSANALFALGGDGNPLLNDSNDSATTQVDIDVTGGATIRTTGASLSAFSGAYGVAGHSLNGGAVDIAVSGAGTSVTTGCHASQTTGICDAAVANRGGLAHAIYALSYDAETNDGTGGGDLSITIGAGAAVRAYGAEAHGIYGQAGVSATGRDALDGAGDVDIDVTDATIETSGASGHGIYARAFTGNITIDIMGGSRVAASGANSRAIYMRSHRAGDLILNIGADSVVCAGAMNAANLCVAGQAEGLAAIVMERPSGRSGTTTLSNDGRIIGRVIMNHDDNMLINNGSLTGGFDLGAGADRMTNTSFETLALTSGGDFGEGADDFSNLGRLVFFDDGRILNLENMRIGADSVLEFHNERRLTGAAAFDPLINSARATVARGARIDVTPVGPRVDVIPLFPSPAISDEDLAELAENLMGGYFLPRSPSSSVPIRVRIFHNTPNSLQTYYALMQGEWLRDRDLERQIRSAECRPALSASQAAARKDVVPMGFCGWERIGGRYTKRSPNHGFRYNEDAYSLIVGFHRAFPKWRATMATGYERANLTIQSRDEGHLEFSASGERFFMSAGAGTHGAFMAGLFDADIQARVGFTLYEAGRVTTLAEISNRGKTELVSVAGAFGLERSFSASEPLSSGLGFLPSFEGWSVVPRMEIGGIFMEMDGFTEGGNQNEALTVEKITHSFAYGSVSLEARYISGDGGDSYRSAWLRLAADVLATRPHAELAATYFHGAESVTARARMDRALFDVGLGVGYQPAEGVEFNLRYDFSASASGATIIHAATARINITF